ncbi:flagellar hook protein FlgE [Brucella grignonensis]|uniref:Flagellar hook protein FlgE n=1 Tax=Brucella grignonensis TaxID=94627 RepID=A0A256F9R2_9HYPH|nr:flagellar hook protein FlgE [Brucella grignonensis]NKB84384.1 flagellar hook protein FlgE [Brucella grignonensis]OYR11607.1 flagellar hook protein FlgE [Brucella grignonensis]
MSLYGMMRTGVSGMNAQANRLSAVADNIANASTVGYKRADAQFSSLVLPSTAGQYNSGSVATNIRYGISDQGGIRSTSSATDLAIDGNGYFVVSNADGTPYLTRAGSFVPDQFGNLVNTAGYYLMGYPADTNGNVNNVANGFDGLQRVNISQSDLVATPSTSGDFTVNLPSTDTVPATAGDYNHKTSLIAYDNLGGKITLDVYFTKTGDNTWDVSVKNAADGVEVGTTTLNFDGTNGSLLSGGNVAVDLAGYNGQTLNLNLGSSKQLAKEYTISEAVINGQAPSSIKGVDIGKDGSVVALYENGSQKLLYRIPLGTVASPDRMSVISGNVFSPSADSGNIQLGFPESGGMGKVSAGALEESNADIAQELTDMIEAQRSYTANSKVFQTGSELMDVLVNLKR